MSFCETIRKDEVLDFLKSQGLAWREQTMMYLRIGDNQKKLDELIEVFSAKMYSDDMVAQTENQLKSYFGNWARNELQREKKEHAKDASKPMGSFAEYAHGIDGKNFAESWNKFLTNSKKH